MWGFFPKPEVRMFSFSWQGCFSTDLRVYQKSDKFWETYKSENRARSGIPIATYLLSQFQNRKAGYPSRNVGPYRQILAVMQL